VIKITPFGRVTLRILFVVSIFLITILSIVPDDAERGITIPKLTSSGFFVHAFAYLATTLFGFLAFRSAFIKILLFFIFYNIALEFLQLYIPYRSFNPTDIAANLAGILLAVIFFFTVRFDIS